MDFPDEPVVTIRTNDREILRQLDRIQWLLLLLILLVAFGECFIVFMFAGRAG